MPSDTDSFTFTWTGKQLYEVRSALKKRKQFLKQGYQRGTVEEQEILLIEALRQDIKDRLLETEA